VGADDGAARLDLSVFGRERGMQGKLEIAIAGGTGPVTPDGQNHFSLPLADRSMTHGYQIPIADRFAGAITADVLLSGQRGDTLSFFQNLPSGESVRTPHLYPGTYTLRTSLFANNQLLESQLSTIKVPFHLTERWWSWTILAATIIAFVYFVQRGRIKRQALIAQLTQAQLDLSETRREKDRMQISTLAGTINPHFISNAIEWLQSAYLVGRPIEKMDEMAENLSDVIRMIFTKAFSETPSHPLKTELDLVERYFRTVNIQYDEAYDFRLPPQEDIDALGHHEVLLMQLQVHVENAVEHGLRYRNKANKVSIRLSQDDDYIYATVEDDGAGVDYVREKQAEMNRRNGVGTSIMRKLQYTFNQYNQLLLDTTIDSPTSTDKDGKPYGTCVTVVIPKHYSYALKSLGG
jgi:anti-sigma regulatory factor (Ser/Thr protein kinase)